MRVCRKRLPITQRAAFGPPSFCLVQDVRDLTYWKVEYWDAGYEILRHSDGGDLAERYEAGQHRMPERT
jgi:hypothetical protein